jgi:magnesium transporter
MESSRQRRARRAHPGAAPGSLVIDEHSAPCTLRAIAYGPGGVEAHGLDAAADVKALLGAWPVVWINCDGLGDEKTLRELGDVFGLHPLALGDIANTSQRSKVEQYSGHQFIVMRMVSMDDRVRTEQISMVLGEGFLLTFQETVGDCLDSVRGRIEKAGSRLRESGADYLAYAVIDAITDHYFPVLETLGERIEDLEQETIEQPDQRAVARIHAMKRDLLALRRCVWPKREALSSLYRDPLPLIHEDTRLFLRDCYDHTVQIIDMVETYRELVSGLMDLYLTSVSNRMNEIMKVLTIIATIFIPLGFIAGLYGMNFDRDASAFNMPELGWPYGYLFCLGLMAAVAVGLLLFFRRKGWLSGAD